MLAVSANLNQARVIVTEAVPERGSAPGAFRAIEFGILAQLAFGPLAWLCVEPDEAS